MLLNFSEKPVLAGLILPSLLTLRVAGTAVNPTDSQDFHLISTPRIIAKCRDGACPVLPGKQQTLRSAPENALPLGPSRKFRRTPKRKTVQKLKIAWRLCYSRKPFRELCPRMRTPEKGSNGGLQYWMPNRSAKTQQITQTLIHLSST